MICPHCLCDDVDEIHELKTCSNETIDRLIECAECGFIGRLYEFEMGPTVSELVKSTGVTACQAAASLKLMIDCIPDDIWKIIDDEAKRRCVKL